MIKLRTDNNVNTLYVRRHGGVDGGGGEKEKEIRVNLISPVHDELHFTRKNTKFRLARTPKVCCACDMVVYVYWNLDVVCRRAKEG